MNKIKTALVILIIAFLVAAFFIKDEIEVTITQNEVSEMIKESMPLNISKFGVDLRINEAKVSFLKDNKLRAEAPFKTSGSKIDGVGYVNLVSGLSYRNKVFYLDKAEVIQFDFAHRNSDEVNRLKNEITVAAKGMFNKLSDNLFREKDEEGKKALNSIVKAALPEIKKKLSNHIKQKFEEIPIYSLKNKDAKHTIASMVLKNFRFENEKIVVTLSIGLLFSNFFLYSLAIMLAIALLVVFIRSNCQLAILLGSLSE